MSLLRLIASIMILSLFFLQGCGDKKDEISLLKKENQELKIELDKKNEEALSKYTPLVVALVIILIIVIVILRNKAQEAKKLKDEIENKKEEISKKDKDINDLELNLTKEKLELEKNIHNLQDKIKQGEKNQIVSKIEELKRKREIE